MRNLLLVVAALGCAAFITSCGELTQPTQYKQGEYRGKHDGVPWEGGAFKGDKAAWDKAIKARNNAQNEYARTGN